jgi:WD domain, G-beta repeat
MGPKRNRLLARNEAERLLIVWTGGELVWNKAQNDFDWDRTTALPPSLAGAFKGHEPFYQDLRWARTDVDLSRKHQKFGNTLARLSAAIRGLSLDEVYGEDVREQRRTLRFLWTGIAVLLLATLLAGWGWWAELQARTAAEEQTRIAESRRLAAESSSTLGQYPQRSLLLAVEAVNLGKSVGGVRAASAEQALRDALSVIGGHPLVETRSTPIVMAISLDNRWFATGSEDGTARLWDLTGAKPTSPPVVLRGHTGALHALAISSDNHWLVTGSRDKTARLWDLTAKDPGAKPIVLPGHEIMVYTVGISPDNHWVVTGSNKTARLWDLTAEDPAAGPIVLHGHESAVYAVALVPTTVG